MSTTRGKYQINYLDDAGEPLVEESIVLASTGDAIQVASIRIRAHDSYVSAAISMDQKWLATVRWRENQFLISRNDR